VNGCPSRPLLFRGQSAGQLAQTLMESDQGICCRFNCGKTEQRAVSSRVEELSLGSNHGVGQQVKVLLLKSSSRLVAVAGKIRGTSDNVAEDERVRTFESTCQCGRKLVLKSNDLSERE